MKRNIYIIIAVFFLFLGNIVSYSSANCGGVLDNGVGSWTVASDCTISDGLYSAWGNTIVGASTVTIASNAALITNLVSNNITFTTGKINMSGGATIYGEASEFTWYTTTTTGVAVDGGRMTTCPSGKKAWNPITNNFIVTSTASSKPANSVIHASSRGWIICK